jgi:hypothetical protein
MQNLLTRAIRDRSVVGFHYDGHPRAVEPHCLGLSPKGALLLRAYQISGSSSSGDPVAWRLFTVSKIVNARVSEHTFSRARPDYNPADSAMATVIAAL